MRTQSIKSRNRRLAKGWPPEGSGEKEGKPVDDRRTNPAVPTDEAIKIRHKAALARNRRPEVVLNEEMTFMYMPQRGRIRKVTCVRNNRGQVVPQNSMDEIPRGAVTMTWQQVNQAFEVGRRFDATIHDSVVHVMGKHGDLSERFHREYENAGSPAVRWADRRVNFNANGKIPPEFDENEEGEPSIKAKVAGAADEDVEPQPVVRM